MDFAIERMEPEGIEELREVLVALHHHEIGVDPTLGGIAARDDDAYWEHYRSTFAPRWAAGNGFGFIARAADGRPIGFIYAIERDGLAAYESSETIGYVEEIAVLDEARGSGVGRALMDAAREVFRERGFSHFELSSVPHNEPAREFYRALGMDTAAVLMIGEV